MDSQPKATVDRLNGFSDGVLAIVVTLLVLGIDIPETHDFTADGLVKFLIKLEPGFAAYFISFLLGITYWVQHHFIFHFAKYTNKTFIWLNAFFLLVATLLPFASKVRTLYRYDFLVVVIYAVVHILCSLSLLAIWQYLAKSKSLQESAIDDQSKRNFSMRLLMTPVICVVAVIISFYNVHVGTYFFILIPIVNMFFQGYQEVKKRSTGAA